MVGAALMSGSPAFAQADEKMMLEALQKKDCAGFRKANFSFEFKTSDMKVVNIDATTIWANHGGTWMAVFHQESTAAKKSTG